MKVWGWIVVVCSALLAMVSLAWTLLTASELTTLRTEIEGRRKVWEVVQHYVPANNAGQFATHNGELYEIQPDGRGARKVEPNDK